MIRSLNLLKYSLNVSQRTHVRLLSSSRGVRKTIIPSTFTGVDTNVRQQLHHTRPVRLWISSCAGVSVSHHSYSTQQTESTEEETLHSIISDTENIQELISNGSDALEKLRHKMITAGGDTAPMEIHLQTDAAKGTFTIQAFLDALQNQAETSSSIILLRLHGG
ncbi:heat shock 75 mitochondrial [Labeo rohita]|uniref:Heat shock 75 mitochondrial n=1 Tax=Labeo rohita TaxID=84645 RepID=A0A498NDP5_LABRO|nr:heat shock 75 mitochondrial [Labeo rohita]